MISTKVYAYVGVVIAVFAVSTGASALRMAYDVPPLLKASWRMQSSFVVSLVPFMIQWHKATPEQKAKAKEHKTLYLLMLSGVSLAIHFGTWIWSLNLTSLLHSLLFVSAHPLIIVVCTMIGFRMGWVSLNVSQGEVYGSILGFVALCLTMLDSNASQQQEDSVTVLGDAVAFLGAGAIVVYMVVGRMLRPHIPLFVYVLPVSGIAAVVLMIVSLFAESPIAWDNASSDSLFGWSSVRWILLFAFLALVPNLLGHTVINMVLRYIPPLIVSVSLVFEPILGTILGWMVGLAAPPGIFTWIFSPLAIIATIWVIVANEKRQEAKENGNVDEQGLESIERK